MYGLSYDVSHWNGTIDFTKIKNPITINGLEYVPELLIIKATQGLNDIDSQLTNNSNGAVSAGIQKTYYHFATVSAIPSIQLSATQQAQFFYNTISTLPLADVPYALDIETNPENINPNDYYLWVTTFIQELFELSGKSNIIIYSTAAFLNANLPPTHTLGNFYLWIAEYGVFEAQVKVPVGFKWWNLWQFEQTGNSPAIQGNCDFSFIRSALV